MSQQINLLNPLLVKQKDVLDANLLLMVSGGVVLVMLLFAAWTHYRLAVLTQAQQASSAQLASLKARLVVSVAKHAPRQPSRALQDEVNRTEDSVKSHQKLLDYLQGGEFGSRQGFSGYMQAFAVRSTKGLWLTDLAIDDSIGQIRIGGRTLKPDLIPQYIAGLGQEPLLKGREFSALQIRTLENASEKSDVPATAEAKPALPKAVITEFKLQSVEKTPETSEAQPPAPQGKAP